MSAIQDTISEPIVAPFQRRSPAAPIAAALGVGIAVDHHVPLPLLAWLGVAAAAFAVWCVCFAKRRLRIGAICLLLAIGAMASAWHHLNWSLVSDDHVMFYVSEAPSPVRIVGRVVDSPWLVPKRESPLPPSVPQSDRVLCTLECSELIENRRRFPVSGRVRLEISESEPSVQAGDVVEAVGRLSRPGVARNPGGFDFRRYLRASGLHAVVRCDSSESVRVVGSSGGMWRRWQSRLRRRSEELIKANLSQETAPLGTALLLGTRSNLPEDVRLAFAESGTTHILAISGTNVGILAILLFGLCRVLGIGSPQSLRTVVAGVLVYAFVAEAQPPVVRAACMLSILLVGRANGRRGAMFNVLALALAFVLLLNPMYLFDVGAQLSFLAVAALLWTPSHIPAGWLSQTSASELPPPSRIVRSVRRVRNGTIESCCMLGAIWLFTLPLTLSRFHLLSLVGIGANVLLAPYVFVVLMCGYLLLIAGWVTPLLAYPFGCLFDWGLRGMLWLVQHSAGIPLGHQYVAGPSEWWLVGFYVVLAAIVLGSAGGPIRWLGRRALLGWIATGLAISLWPAEPPGLRCTFLSVGHGGAVLLELPGGETVLYDAGQLTDGTRAQQTVQNALWSRGRSQIDALVISHADVDHFNGVPGLAQTVSIDTALFHRTFLDFKQPSVDMTCKALDSQGVKLRLIGAGDRLHFGPQTEVDLAVLQPAAGSQWESDNANSVVLRVKYVGRTILLTGDLEGDGLRHLLAEPREPIDILLAPHHGSANANTRELARWAEPTWVVSSSGRPGIGERLQNVYGSGARVLSTHEAGAVTFTITPDGEIHEQIHLPRASAEE